VEQELIAALKAQTEALHALAAGIHALAESIAAATSDELQPESEPSPSGGPMYADGTPIG
jgi:hypothetical protein